MVGGNKLVATGATWADVGATWATPGDVSWAEFFGNGDSPITYETEVFDLGADDSVIFNLLAQGVGTVLVEARFHTNAQGADLSGESYAAAPTTATTLRYVQFRVTVTGTSPLAQLNNFTIILSEA